MAMKRSVLSAAISFSFFPTITDAQPLYRTKGWYRESVAHPVACTDLYFEPDPLMRTHQVRVMIANLCGRL